MKITPDGEGWSIEHDGDQVYVEHGTRLPGDKTRQHVILQHILQGHGMSVAVVKHPDGRITNLSEGTLRTRIGRILKSKRAAAKTIKAFEIVLRRGGLIHLGTWSAYLNNLAGDQCTVNDGKKQRTCSVEHAAQFLARAEPAAKFGDRWGVE